MHIVFSDMFSLIFIALEVIFIIFKKDSIKVKMYGAPFL